MLTVVVELARLIAEQALPLQFIVRQRRTPIAIGEIPIQKHSPQLRSGNFKKNLDRINKACPVLDTGIYRIWFCAMDTKRFRAHVRIRCGGKKCFSSRQILMLRSGVRDPALMVQSRGRIAYPVYPVNPVKITFFIFFEIPK